VATTAELVNAVLSRVGEDPAAPAFYQAFEVLDALNEGQRFFAFLTLCLETKATLDAGGSATHHLLASFPDFLLALRCRWTHSGERIRPGRMQDFAAEADNWLTLSGDAQRYGVAGFDMLVLDRQPDAGSVIEITYARMPAVMTTASSPEIPIEFHPAIEDYGVYRLRMAKEGGQEGAKTLELFSNFLTTAKAHAETVRKRMVGADYDAEPFELKEKRWRTMLQSPRAPA